MINRNWKKLQPQSLTHAFRLCKEFGVAKKRLSVERIADLMGTNVDTLYKWIASGRMPANMIRPFENACGCTYVTQYICTSGHKLLINMPSSKPAKDMDVLELQKSFNHAVEMLIGFYQGEQEADPVLGELASVMSRIAEHRASVEMATAPELDLFAGEDA